MLNFPNLKYVSGNFTIAKAVSLPVKSRPFSKLGIKDELVLTQDFQIDLNYFADLDLDTPHSDFPDFILVEESEQRALSGGRVQWTRTYAKIPNNFSRDIDNYPYVYPALATGLTTTSRSPTRITAAARIQYDFLLTTNPSIDFPVIPQQRYVLDSDADTDATYQNGPAVADSIPGSTLLTVPSLTDYRAMIAAASEIVPEDSKRDIWMGNIYQRTTIYIPAK